MENQITCPACKRTITNNPVVDSAAKGEDHVLGSEYVICECGERISYWAITAQLREQKNPQMVSQPLQGLMPSRLDT
jgi:hypothetical protein